MGDAVTFFSVPRAFEGACGVRQRNAVRSWLLLDMPVILFGDDPGVAEFSQEHGCVHVPEVKCSEWNTPLVNDVFDRAQGMIQGLAVFVNTDIIFLDDSVVQAVRIAADRFDSFLVIGTRVDVDLHVEIDFENQEWRTLALESPPVLHGIWGIDYLGFRSPLWEEMLPLAIGRMKWDGWLAAEAHRLGAQLIEAENVIAIHQNHGYEHIEGQLEDSSEVKRNTQLVGGAFLGVCHTDWILDDEGLHRR